MGTFKQLMTKLTPKQIQQILDAQKEGTSEGIQKWMDKMFQRFGYWSAGGLAVLAFGYFIKWLISMHGGTPIGVK